MAAKKADIAVIYRINDTLDISVRNMGVRPRLGKADPERQWEYIVKFRGTVLFKGTDFYTDEATLHQYAACSLLKFFVPEDGDMDSLPWIDVDNLSPSRARWFIAGYKDFKDVHSHMDSIAEFPDCFAVLGDGSLAPFGEDGLAMYGDHLDELRYMEERRKEVAKQESMANHPSNV